MNHLYTSVKSSCRPVIIHVDGVVFKAPLSEYHKFRSMFCSEEFNVYYEEM